jgi:transcriptional regulator with GAF, ATPase, and Fis domain
MVAMERPSTVDQTTQNTAMVVSEHELAITAFRLRVIDGPEAGRVVDGDGAEVTVGSAQGNDLIIEDPTLSRHHFTITATEDGFLLRDRGSTNGTTLGGYRVRTAYLESGNVIGAGRSRLVFETSNGAIRQPLSRAARFGGVLGESAAMRRVFALLERLAPTDTTVLLLGETGTGKGAAAEAVHQKSARADKPFVVVDCGAIPPMLMESELFGHEKGAFTGAHATRIGQFEAARGGTVFLDEIGELPLDLQPKLLRVLDKRMLRRVGSLEPIPVDVRIIAATNRDLRREVNRGAFRADLFYRLSVASVTLPPLRERRDDIPALVARFWEELRGAGAEPPAALMSALARQDWPGNVRQLRNAVERASLFDGTAGAEPVEAGGAVAGAAPATPVSAASLAEPDEPGSVFEPGQSFRVAKEAIVTRWEKAWLGEVVRRSRGNISRAARLARMDRNHLRDLLRRHNIEADDGDGV